MHLGWLCALETIARRSRPAPIPKPEPGPALSVERAVKLFLSPLLSHLGAHMLSGQEVFTRYRNWLHVDGYSHHFDAPGANPALLGFGITRYDRRQGRVVRAWEADVFQDSGRKLSAYVGLSWTVPVKTFPSESPARSCTTAILHLVTDSV